MQRQSVIEMILVDRPLPTQRERQSSWLQFNFALLADLPMENVSVVYADDQEAVSVHIVCTNPCRCTMTFTHWCDSDDNDYTFVGPNDVIVHLPFEPHAGEE